MKSLDRTNPLPCKIENDNRELWRSEDEVLFEFLMKVNSIRQYCNV